MSDEERSERWNTYYEKVQGQPPRPTLIAALDLFDAEGGGAGRLAVDLGCGSGTDTVEMLRRGWRVLAIDRESDGLEMLRARVPEEHRERLETRVAAFEELEAIPRCMLVNASFSLPFCAPDHFPLLWERIRAAIVPGGRFAGQHFGDRDGWSHSPTMNFHRQEELDELFAGFDIESLVIRDELGETAVGESKHWHVFSVVARRGAISEPTRE